RRERIRRDLGTTGGNRADEGTLTDVRIAGHDDRRHGRIDLRDAPERAPGLDEGVQVRRDLRHERGETAVRLSAQAPNRGAGGPADPTAGFAGDLAGPVRGPSRGREMLLELATVHEGVDQLPVEGRQSVRARQPGEVPAPGL